MSLVTSTATTPEEYLNELPEERRAALQAVREVILANKPKEVEEGMQYGHIGYYVPHSIYPAGYHCDPKQPLPYCGLGSQKNHMALYLFCLYAHSDLIGQFKEKYLASGKKLDMGAGCVRFKKLENLPLDLIAETVRKIDLDSFIVCYEQSKPSKKK